MAENPWLFILIGIEPYVRIFLFTEASLEGLAHYFAEITLSLCNVVFLAHFSLVLLLEFHDLSHSHVRRHPVELIGGY